jgi:hypothetical protein
VKLASLRGHKHDRTAALLRRTRSSRSIVRKPENGNGAFDGYVASLSMFPFKPKELIVPRARLCVIRTSVKSRFETLGVSMCVRFASGDGNGVRGATQ